MGKAVPGLETKKGRRGRPSRAGGRIARRALLLVAVTLVGAALAVPTAGAARLVPRDAEPMQMSYELWTVTWMRAALKRSVLAPTSLLMVRGNKCGFAFGKMWLLPDAFVARPEVDIETRCTIPRGKFVFVPIQWAFGPGNNHFLNAIPAILSSFADRSLTVDGEPLYPGYFVRTPVFTHEFPFHNAVGATPGSAASAGFGYFAILAPLSPGEHVITTFSGFSNPDAEGSVTFRLTAR